MDMEISEHAISNVSVDEGLYSRQLYVMGFEAQRKMAQSDVLLVGLNGLGIEVAKNIILAGVKSVTVLDNIPVSYEDLSSQFYCTESDIGRPRSTVCVPKLAELNPYVPVSVIYDDLTTSLVSGFRVVVLIDVKQALRQEIANYCHTNKIAVIISDIY